MTAKESYNILKNEFPEQTVVGSLEFDDFYAFTLRDKGKEDELVGGCMITVDKKSGSIGSFLPQQNFKAYLAAKEINLSTFE